jgi:hypothetical protein
VSSYPVPSCAVPVSAGMIIAVPADRLASPLKSGRDPRDADRSALVIGGTEKIRTGSRVLFCKIVAVAEAVVAREGQVRAEGRPYDHATLGPLEDWLDAQAGPGVIDGIAERAVLDEKHVKGKYRRLLTAAFMIRVLVLWTLMPEARLSDVIIALAGDLALLPWSRRWHPASERACPDWRRALGPGPLEELQAIALGAAAGEHREHPGGVPDRRNAGAAGSELARRVAAAGAGHAGEPGRVRVRRHRGRFRGLAVRAAVPPE